MVLAHKGRETADTLSAKRWREAHVASMLNGIQYIVMAGILDWSDALEALTGGDGSPDDFTPERVRAYFADDIPADVQRWLDEPTGYLPSDQS